MPMFKVWNQSKTMKKSIVAENLEELKRIGCQTLSIEPQQLAAIVFERDGTEIDSDEVLIQVQSEVLIFLLQEGESWNEMDQITLPLDDNPGMKAQVGTDNDAEEIRIVLLGKTGSGKSATGNSMLKMNQFKSVLSATSVTQKTEFYLQQMGNKRLRIVDTPGLFDNSDRMSTFQLKKEILKCITMSSPGPHIFLYVIRIGVLTLEETQTAIDILKLFGDDIQDFITVVFTGLDVLGGKEGFQAYLKSLPHSINELFEAFGNRIIPINNISGKEEDKDEFIASVLDIVRQRNWNYFSNPITVQASSEFYARLNEIRETRNISDHEALEIVLSELRNEGKVFNRVLFGLAGVLVGGALVAATMTPAGPAVVGKVAAVTAGWSCNIS